MTTTATIEPPSGRVVPFEERESVTIRFAGDSGDGMQLAGTQFTNASAILGNDISTLPDFPAEIRAPAGTLAGVSGFQVHFPAARNSHARRPARHAGRHEPRRPQDQPQGPANRAASSSSTPTPSPPATCTRPATRPIRSKTARSRATASIRVPINKLNREAVAEVQAEPARGGPLQELLRPGPGLLALRAPAGADAEVDPRQVRQEPGRARGQHRGP